MIRRRPTRPCLTSFRYARPASVWSVLESDLIEVVSGSGNFSPTKTRGSRLPWLCVNTEIRLCVCAASPPSTWRSPGVLIGAAEATMDGEEPIHAEARFLMHNAACTCVVCFLTVQVLLTPCGLEIYRPRRPAQMLTCTAALDLERILRRGSAWS